MCNNTWTLRRQCICDWINSFLKLWPHFEFLGKGGLIKNKCTLNLGCKVFHNCALLHTQMEIHEAEYSHPIMESEVFPLSCSYDCRCCSLFILFDLFSWPIETRLWAWLSLWFCRHMNAGKWWSCPGSNDRVLFLYYYQSFVAEGNKAMNKSSLVHFVSCMCWESDVGYMSANPCLCLFPLSVPINVGSTNA